MVQTLISVIVAGLVQVKPPKTGLIDLVFGKAIEETYGVEKIDIDIYDGKRGVAGYTARGSKGQTVGLEGWDTIQVQPPLIDENFNLTAQDLKVRNFGESAVNTTMQMNKFQNIVNREANKHADRRTRAYTKQVIDLITSGIVTVVEKDDKGNTLASRDIDFSMPASHIYTVGTAWNATGDIFGDIRAFVKTIVKTSGVTPEYAIVGDLTIQDMVNDATVQKLVDNRRMNFGELVKEERGNGLTYWGKFLGLEIYTFTEFDEAGIDIVPESAFIAGSTMAELDVAYGSVDIMDENNNPSVRETKLALYTKADHDAVARQFGTKSAKLFCLTQAGAFGHMTTR